MGWTTQPNWVLDAYGNLVNKPKQVWVPDPVKVEPGKKTPTKPGGAPVLVKNPVPPSTALNAKAKSSLAKLRSQKSAEMARAAAWQRLKQRQAEILRSTRLRAPAGAKPSLPKVARVQQQASNRLKEMRELRESDNYEDFFKQLERRQLASGGRYVDSDRFEKATKQMLEQAAQAQADLEAEYSQVKRLYEAASAADQVGDDGLSVSLWKQIQTIVNSPQYRSLWDEYARWYGDDRTPGLVQKVSEIQNRMAQRRDRWLSSTIFNANPYSKDLVNRLFDQQDGGRSRAVVGIQSEARRESQMALQAYLDRVDAGTQVDYAARLYKKRSARPQYGTMEIDGVQVPIDEQTHNMQRITGVLQRAPRIEDARLERLMADAQSDNRQVAQRALQELARLAVDSYVFEKGPTRRTDTWEGIQAWDRERKQWEDTVYSTLFGPGGLDGIGRFLNGALGAPILGPALQLAQAPSSLLGGAVRDVVSGLSGGGQLAGRDVNFFSDKPFLTVPFGDEEIDEFGVGVSPRAKRAQARAKRELDEILNDPTRSWWEKLDARNAYGAQLGIQGNIGIGFEAVLDPLNFTGVGGALRRGRMAIGTTAGTRGLKRVANFQEDFWSYALPRKFGGLGHDTVTEMLRREAIARELHIPPNELYALSPEAMSTYSERLLVEAAQRSPERASRLERLFNADPIRNQQLMAATSAEARRQLGTKVAHPASYNRLLSEAEQAIRRAELHKTALERAGRAADTLTEQVRALADAETARRIAAGELDLSTRRLAAGASPDGVELAPGFRGGTKTPFHAADQGKPRRISAAELKFHNELVASLDQASLDKLAYTDPARGTIFKVRRMKKGEVGVVLVRQPVKEGTGAARAELVRTYETAVRQEVGFSKMAAKELDIVRTSRDQVTRANAYDRLGRIISRLDDYTTRDIEGINGPERRIGLVDAARIAVEEFDSAFRSPVKRPDGTVQAAGVLDLVGERLNRSVSYIQGDIKRLRGDIKALPAGRPRQRLVQQLERSERALAQAKLIRRLQSDSRRAVRRRLRKYGSRLREAIRPDRVAPFATERRHIFAATSRDLRVRALESEVVHPEAPESVRLAELFSRRQSWRQDIRERFPQLREGISDQAGEIEVLEALRELGRQDKWSRFQHELYRELEAAVQQDFVALVRRRAPQIKINARTNLSWWQRAVDHFGGDVDPVMLYSYLSQRNPINFDRQTARLYQELEGFLRDELRRIYDSGIYRDVVDARSRIGVIGKHIRRLRGEIAQARSDVIQAQRRQAERGAPGPEFKAGSRLPFKWNAKKSTQGADSWDAPDVWGMRRELVPGVDGADVFRMLAEDKAPAVPAPGTGFRRLRHFTDPENVDSLVEHGFDRSRGETAFGLAEGVLGDGIYLSLDDARWGVRYPDEAIGEFNTPLAPVDVDVPTGLKLYRVDGAAGLESAFREFKLAFNTGRYMRPDDLRNLAAAVRKAGYEGMELVDVSGMADEFPGIHARADQLVVFDKSAVKIRSGTDATEVAATSRLAAEEAKVLAEMKKTGVPPVVNLVKRGTRDDGGPAWSPRGLHDLAAARVLYQYMDRIPARLWQEAGQVRPRKRPVVSAGRRRTAATRAAMDKVGKATEQINQLRDEARTLKAGLRRQARQVPRFSRDDLIESTTRYVDEVRKSDRVLDDWDELVVINNEVSDAIASDKVRGWRSKGQIRQSSRRLEEPVFGEPGLSRGAIDSDFAVVYAKMLVLKDKGISPQGYDLIRDVTRDIQLREGRADTLLLQARRLAKQGGDIGDHYKARRTAAQEQEVIQNVERLSSHPSAFLLDDDSFISLYEEKFLLEDLAPMSMSRKITPYQYNTLKALYELRAGGDIADNAVAAKHLQVYDIPFGNRQEMRDWAVDTGFWAPRTRQQVESDGFVWSIRQERQLWENRYGYTPPWADPTVLDGIKHFKELWDEAHIGWGVLKSDFEKLQIVGNLSPQQVREAVQWGAHGVQKARTIEELRSWVIARFGDVVSTDGDSLIALPWLMDPLAQEYADWQRAMFRQGYEEPAFWGKQGLVLDRALIRESQVDGLADAVTHAVRKRIEAWKKDGRLDDVTILPEQFNALIYDTVDYLLVEPSWRSFWERGPLAGRITGFIGSFFRSAMIVFTIAFPLVNLIDAFGLRRFILQITKNGWRPLSVGIPDWVKESVQSMESLGLDFSATFHVRGRNGFTNMRDPSLSRFKRGQELFRGFHEGPLRISKFGEDRLRLDFARSQVTNEYARLIKAGVPDADARIQSIANARQIVKGLFPSLEDAPWWVKVINDLIPFLHYNFTLKRLTLGLALDHPWLVLQGDRLAQFINEYNESQWEDEHGDLPMPLEMLNKLVIRIGDTEYTIDVSDFSDWTRSFDLFSESQSVQSVIEEFIRVPHPSQAIFLAYAFGYNDGKTPWGTEARLRDLNIWLEAIHQWTNPFNPADPESKDLIQTWSQLLFFKSFGRVDPLRIKVETYFSLQGQQDGASAEYLSANPDVGLWLRMHGGRFDPFERPSWFRTASQDRIDQFQQARDGYSALAERYDRRLADYYLEPWSQEYRDLKKERRAVLAQYVQTHPVLTEVWNSKDGWDPVSMMRDWVVDEQMDRFFELAETRPVAEDFKTELAYAEAVQAWVDVREAWLAAHPEVEARLRNARNEVEQAWFDHEAHWAEIMDFTADLKIRRLKEEAKGVNADRDIIDTLYQLTEDNYQRLNAESFGRFYDAIENDRSGETSFTLGERASSMLRRLKSTVAFPGRADFFYENATPEEQREIREDERYFSEIGAFTEGLDDPREFWSKLEQNPQLLAEYLRRNPDRRVDFQYARDIAAVFNKGGFKHFWDNLVAKPALLQQYLKRGGQDARNRYNRYLTGKRYFNEITALFNGSGGAENFFAQLEKNPWLRDQYYARNPEKRNNSRYFREITALFNATSDGRSFYEGLEKNAWLKAEYFRRHPDRAASFEAGQQYYGWMRRWVDALQAGNAKLADQVWNKMPAWVRERYLEGGGQQGDPSRSGTLRGTAYYNALGGWIKLLEDKKFDEAAAYFEALPDWMKEKYYAKHPDQRAKNELDNRVLAQAARYFLATGDDRVAELRNNPELAVWLKEHGGDEAAFRGLIFAIYRSLPAGNAWLKRTFRERYPEIFSHEAVGERALASVRRRLAENPELEPYYEKQLALQRRLYSEQLRRSGVPPKPLTMERKKRLRKRTRRRTARLGSHWSKHRAIRLQLA